MITVKNTNANSWKVIGGAKEIAQIIEEKDLCVWEKGGHRRVYFGGKRDNSYYDLITETFVLQSRNCFFHVTGLCGDVEKDW